jgi:transcriptional regulator with XRE-family HTH domain
MSTKSWNAIKKVMEADPDHERLMVEARQETDEREQAYFRGLADVRRARDLTQEELAEALGIKQTSVSKIERAHERHADLYLSTLRRFIEAMGGELKLVAAFPDAQIPIDNFRHIDESNPEIAQVPVPEPTAEAMTTLQQAL